jgi:hypothetical protein
MAARAAKIAAGPLRLQASDSLFELTDEHSIVPANMLAVVAAMASG